ncbi:hypothetical protein PCANC_05471 [Puccinia coronata f. sp. avenae]|uniref:Major facilitator superfamily (MFS) profile domain-containing protein n=1 Tax=Puccinia coronata f. sp. avenae TaxID=200324 RepID=A0A2N5TQD5_9BASI|nr:hypothetical protein PCANC_05471 [Puccinia coronata f. sp. avenae]PLW27709.1 hypothetical protein PCASD_17860 [Puccinia coronata f. sp. avenae]
MAVKLVGQPLLYTISIFASLGVFLFGYDQGVMSGIITGPYFKAFFHQPTRYELGTMVAILEIGAFITSIIAGRIGDIFGRRKTLFIGALVFTVGGLCQSLCSGFTSMVFGRVISGFGVGFLSTIVPIYQSEISPADHRGKLACMEFTGNVFGYAASVWLDYFSSYIESDWSWRFPLFFQCVIGTILMIGSCLIPESPRWLLDTDQDRAGMRVLVDLNGGDARNEKARQEYTEIKEAVLDDRLAPDRSYLAMWTRYRGRVLLAMSAQAFAQLNGINVIGYYAPLIFESAGWIGRDAILMTGINGTVYVFSTIPTWYLVDEWGRRFILLSGSVVMALSLTFMGWFLYLDTTYTPLAVVGCVLIYNAFFGYSWGPIPWLYPPEIMPLPFRVKGVSISTATNWFFNYLVGEATPVLQDAIRWRLYPMHACFCVMSFILVYFAYPETCGIPLEDMDELFGDVGLEDHENQSLVNSERSSIQRALEPPDLTAISLGDDDEQGNHVGKSYSASWLDRLLALGKSSSEARSNAGYHTAAPNDE